MHLDGWASALDTSQTLWLTYNSLKKKVPAGQYQHSKHPHSWTVLPPRIGMLMLQRTLSSSSEFHPSFTRFFLDSVFLVGCFFCCCLFGVCFFVCFWFCIYYFLGRGRYHSELCKWSRKKPQLKTWSQVCFQVQSKPRSVCTNHSLKTSVRVRKVRAFLPHCIWKRV